MTITAYQKAQRLQGIGGSDAGAVLGLCPYKTPLAVYLEKVGESDGPEENARMYWGNRLEDLVAQEYMRQTGNRVRRRNATLVHPEYHFMLANLDREVVGQRRVLECKTADKWTADKWGPSGTDQVPDWYLVQVMHYMIVRKADVADLAVLIGGNDFRIYTIPFDRDLADAIIGHEAEFWHHVERQEPPPPITVDDLATLYAIDNGESLVATVEQERAHHALVELRHELKRLEQQKTELESGLKFDMGPASVLLDGAGRPIVTWKAANASQRFDAKAFAADHPDLYAAYLKTQPGSRRFLIKEPKE